MRRLVTIVFWSISPTCQCVKEGVACENREKCEFTSKNTAVRSIRNDYDLSPLTARATLRTRFPTLFEVNLVPRSLVDEAKGEIWPNPICIT